MFGRPAFAPAGITPRGAQNSENHAALAVSGPKVADFRGFRDKFTLHISGVLRKLGAPPPSPRRLAVDNVNGPRQSPDKFLWENHDMRKLTATALAGAAALAAFTTLHAQGGPQQLPGQADVGRVEAGTYTIDSNHSMVGWKLNHFGFNDYFGIFGDVAGTITVDPANPTASTVDVTIPIASVTVPSSALRDHLLRAGADGKAPDFFGPDPAPARFVSTSIESTGGTSANITGNLTMNGVTKPVVLNAEFAGAGANPMSRTPTIGFHGNAVIKRSDFNVSFGIPFGLSDEIPLDITVAAEKQ